jgi:hypothetical protein
MGGMGKWIKKNPLQAVGLLAGAALGGPAIAGLFGGAGAAGAGAGLVEGAGVLGGAAEGGGGAFAGLSGLAEMPAAGGVMAGLDKMAPYAKYAGQVQGLLAPEQQQQMPPMQQPRPQQMAQAGGSPLPYGNPQEEELRRRMAQTGRFYG